MSTTVALFLFMNTCVMTVQAKAVGKGPTHVTFQDFDSSSPIQVIPQWHTISNQPSPKIAKQVKGYEQLREGKSLIPQETNLPSSLKGKSEKVKYDHRYDLSYHENLESVFDLDSDASKSQLKRKKPNSPSVGSKYRKLKDQIRKQRSDVFLDDQVFIEKNKVSRSPRKVRSLDSIKLDVKAVIKDDSQSTAVEEDLSCDLESLRSGEFVSVGNNDKDGSHVHNSKSQLNNHGTPATNMDKRIRKRDLHPEMIEEKSSIKIPIIDSVTNSRAHTNKPPLVVGNSEAKNNLKDLHEETTPRVTELAFESKVEENPQQIPIKQIVVTPEDKHLMKDEVTQLFDASFRSFVFNPQAEPLEKFQECTTHKNETGYCRYVQHCMLPSLLSSIQQFMENVCIIEGRFVGVCCPEFPVSALQVNWPNRVSNFSNQDGPIQTPKECGISTNTRIIGGSDADRKAWPWMVALFNNENKFFCGGALINNRYVLTASHCTFGAPNNQIIARLGEYDFKNPRDPHDDYLVTEIKRHGQFTSLTLRNDIALLKLDRPVVFNEFIKTVCFPKANKDYLDKMATLVGWGYLSGVPITEPDVLQEASFPIIENIQCTLTHGVPVPSSFICAAAPSKDKGACNGDSGGPLMLLEDDKRWKVIGVVSWGRRGCSPRFPTVYTRVTHYLDWIKKYAV